MTNLKIIRKWVSICFRVIFSSKPVVTKRNKLVQNRAFALKLMQEVNVESPNLNKIEDLLKRDVSLSFKIMRYAQNILYNTRGISGFRNQSLRDVVVYLGISEMRRFVLVACLTSFEEVSNTEIYYLSLIRAKFCELLAARTSENNAINDAFMVGLFSLLDVILGLPLDELLEQITVSPEVAKALQSNSGELYLYLRLARLYEQRIWKEANEVAAQLGLPNALVSELMNRWRQNGRMNCRLAHRVNSYFLLNASLQSLFSVLKNTGNIISIAFCTFPSHF